MRALIERLRLAIRDWLCAPSQAERAQQAEFNRHLDEMREDMRRD